jgi:chemotaxis protein methyltransferase CheR
VAPDMDDATRDPPTGADAGGRQFNRVTEQEFSRLCEFLYRKTGMVFTEMKRYYVERRVNDRMSATGAGSFASYFARLRIDAAGEVEQFVNAFTVNETYFYREIHQLRSLTSDLLRERVTASRNMKTLRIWSVPCSTGEEPYSIALWLLENWPSVDAFDIEIIGSDIDTAVLGAAQAGVFGKRALMHLPPEVVAKYFVTLGGDEWRIIEDIRQSVAFTPVNLIDAVATVPFGRFDVIFCRNVLIYFDDASRRVAAENLYESLLPGGFLCLGHSESMSRISSLFDVRRFSDAIVYQRPGETR